MTFPFSRTLSSVIVAGVLAVAAAGEGCSSSAAPAGLQTANDAGTSGKGNSASSSGSGGSPDASWDGGLRSSCLPGDVSAYKPTWRKSLKFYQGVCSYAEVDAFRASCLSSDVSACAKAVNADCAKCLATDEAAEAYGAVIVHRGWVELNEPGCVANAMNDPTGVRCAAAMQALDRCELAACSANCPVSSEATLNALDGCRTAAEAGQCVALAGDAACAQANVDAGSLVAACIASVPFAEGYTTIARLFCAANPIPPPSDAGAGG